MALEMPEIEVPEDQKRWIMCEKHEFKSHGKNYLEPDNPQGVCRHCGMPVSRQQRGSIKKPSAV